MKNVENYISQGVNAEGQVDNRCTVHVDHLANTRDGARIVHDRNSDGMRESYSTWSHISRHPAHDLSASPLYISERPYPKRYVSIEGNICILGVYATRPQCIQIMVSA